MRVPSSTTNHPCASPPIFSQPLFAIAIFLGITSGTGSAAAAGGVATGAGSIGGAEAGGRATGAGVCAAFASRAAGAVVAASGATVEVAGDCAETGAFGCGFTPGEPAGAVVAFPGAAGARGALGAVCANAVWLTRMSQSGLT